MHIVYNGETSAENNTITRAYQNKKFWKKPSFFNFIIFIKVNNKSYTHIKGINFEMCA